MESICKGHAFYAWLFLIGRDIMEREVRGSPKKEDAYEMFDRSGKPVCEGVGLEDRHVVEVLSVRHGRDDRVESPETEERGSRVCGLPGIYGYLCSADVEAGGACTAGV